MDYKFKTIIVGPEIFITALFNDKRIGELTGIFRKTAFIEYLFVEPEFRRQHIAKNLIKIFLEHCKSKHVEIHAKPIDGLISLEQLQNFYEFCGMKKIRSVVDAVFMTGKVKQCYESLRTK